MKIDEVISALENIRDEYGDIEVLLASSYVHYEIKWIDYSQGFGKHACIRLDDRKEKYDNETDN